MSAPVERCVSARASPPSMETRYTCEFPSRADRNASCLPSGDHTGEESCPLRVSCIGAPLPVGTIQISLAFRFASRSGVATVYATHFPSGDTCVSLTRCIRIKSSNVMGCLAASWARNPADMKSENTQLFATHRRFLLPFMPSSSILSSHQISAEQPFRTPIRRRQKSPAPRRLSTHPRVQSAHPCPRR